jgi:hypothetical protein
MDTCGFVSSLDHHEEAMTMSEPQRVLLTKEEVKGLLGIGDAAFSELGIDFILLGKRRRYLVEDVYKAINERKQGQMAARAGVI